MTAKNRGILKPFGEWATRLINKIKNHIYTYILFAVITSGILSVASWFILNEAAEKIFFMNYSKYAQEIADEIKTTIEEQNLTYYQAMESIDLTKYNEANIRLISHDSDKNHSSNDKKPNSSHNENSIYTFHIDYSDSSGEILMKPMIGLMIPKYMEFIIVLIAALIFMVTLFMFIRKSMKYIEDIDRGIDMIAGGRLEYEIPIKGSNELSRLAVNINEMKKSLQEKIISEREFDIKHRQLITNISHDLRTPITVLIGYLDLLEKHMYEDQDEADDYIKCAAEKCIKLQKLVEDLFNYNKLINGDIPVCIEEINIIELVNKNISSQGFEINLISEEKEILLPVDKKIINRIFDNLLDNIRKYGVNNAPACIYIKNETGKVIIIVENSTEDDLSNKVESIFDRMYVGNESRTHNSSGLGLSIVAECVKLMHGSIYAEFKNHRLQIIMEFKKAI